MTPTLGAAILSFDMCGARVAAHCRVPATVKDLLSPVEVHLRDLAMNKSQNWTGTANDCCGEIDLSPDLAANGSSRCTRAVHDQVPLFHVDWPLCRNRFGEGLLTSNGSQLWPVEVRFRLLLKWVSC